MELIRAISQAIFQAVSNCLMLMTTLKDLTVAIDKVAKANGSPRMFSIRILLVLRRSGDCTPTLLFILLVDGERNDP